MLQKYIAHIFYCIDAFLLYRHFFIVDPTKKMNFNSKIIIEVCIDAIIDPLSYSQTEH